MALDAPMPMAVDPMALPSTSGRVPIPEADVKLPLELNTRVRWQYRMSALSGE
jgi:hypothetical protein